MASNGSFRHFRTVCLARLRFLRHMCLGARPCQSASSRPRGVGILPLYENVLSSYYRGPIKLTKGTPMDLSLQKLTEALSIKQQINSLERRLSSLFAGGGSSASSSTTSKGKGSRKRKAMSTATRAKLVAAARARWAQRKGGRSSAKAPAKKKGGLTAAGRKRLSDAMKARWAARLRSSSGDGGPKRRGTGDGGPKRSW